MSLDEVMRMPIRTFWSFTKNINRIQADNDLRAMDIALSANSGEFAKELRERLIETLKSPVKAEEKIDHKAGIAKLRGVLGAM